jgi:hypothetical protein
MRLLDRWRAWRARGAVVQEQEVAAAHDELEREILQHDVSGVKDDAFVGGGDGLVTPGLPEATPREVYREFEHDEERPVDRAP